MGDADTTSLGWRAIQVTGWWARVLAYLLALTALVGLLGCVVLGAFALVRGLQGMSLAKGGGVLIGLGCFGVNSFAGAACLFAGSRALRSVGREVEASTDQLARGIRWISLFLWVEAGSLTFWTLLTLFRVTTRTH